jgi:hypothetical protein
MMDKLQKESGITTTSFTLAGAMAKGGRAVELLLKLLLLWRRR